MVRRFGEGAGPLFESAGLPQQEPLDWGQDFPDSTTTFEPAPAEAATKFPWELDDAEYAAANAPKDAPQLEKMPWETDGGELAKLSPADIGITINEEQKGAEGKGSRVSGARGQKPQFKLADRTSTYGRAQRSDVGVEGVSAAARFNAALAWGAVTDPTQELEIARRAISRDLGVDYPIENLRVGPGTKALEWVNPKTGKWDLFAGAGEGSLFKDIAAAAPELAEFVPELAGGMAGGATGFGAGSLLGPTTAGAGGLAGNSLGSGAAAYFSRLVRLQEAKARGMLPDMTDEQMHADAWSHAKLVAGVTVAAGALHKVVGKIWELYKGSPAEMLETFKHTERLMEGKPLVEALDLRAQSATGQRFPVTSSQQGALPEIFKMDPTSGVMSPRAAALPRDRAIDEGLKAESAARRLRVPGAEGLDERYAQQQKVTDATDFAVFGEKSWAAEQEAGRILQRNIDDTLSAKRIVGEGRIRGAVAQGRLAQLDLEQAGQRSTMESAANMREAIGDAREQLFRPFQDAYTALEGNSSKVVDVTELRAAARDVEKRMGQEIIKSLDSTDIPAIKEAKRAGIKETLWGNLIRRVNEPQSIGKVETLRKDLTEAIRQLDKRTGPSATGGQPGAPRARQVLIELRDGLDRSLSASVTPEVYQDILNLRQGYARAQQKFNQGIIGRITEDEGFGAYKMSGNQIAEHLMKDPANARAFIEAARHSDILLPGQGLVRTYQTDLTRSVQYAQEGVLSHLVRQFKSAETGKWDTKGLSSWLHDHAEAAQELFGWKVGQVGQLVPAPSNVVNRIAKDVTRWQRQADVLEGRLKKMSDIFEKRFGMFTGNPTTLARGLIAQGKEGDLNMALKLVQKAGGPAEAQKFRHGIASAARREISNGDGTLNLTKLDKFVESERGELLGRAMGPRWADNVKTLRDMLKVRDLEASGMAPRDLANNFTLGVPGLRGMSRFLRVPMPPMSASGRGLTGFIGMVNDRTQKRLGEMLADPELLAKFMARAKGPVWDPLSKAGKVQLARFGLEHVGEFWDAMKNLYGITVDQIIQDDEQYRMRNEGRDERAQWQEYGNMGREVPGMRAPGGETPGYGKMPDRLPESQPEGASRVPGASPEMKLGGPEGDVGRFARGQVGEKRFEPGLRTDEKGNLNYEFAPGVARTFEDTTAAERMAADREEADQVERGLVNSGPHQAPTGEMMKAGGKAPVPANDNVNQQAVRDIQKMLQDQIKAGLGNGPVANTMRQLLKDIESGGMMKLGRGSGAGKKDDPINGDPMLELFRRILGPKGRVKVGARESKNVEIRQ